MSHCIHRIASGGYYGFDFVTPTPPQCVERFHRYRSNEKNIIASPLKFAGYIHSHKVDLSTVSIKIPQIGKHPVYYNSNNQSFPPIFIGAILNYKNVAIFRDIFVNIIAFWQWNKKKPQCNFIKILYHQSYLL